MYGSVRITLLDRAAHIAGRLVRPARLFIELAAGQTRWRPIDLYAAAMTARFMAAHELIERADQACDDDEIDLIQIRQPMWFGGTTIFEEK